MTSTLPNEALTFETATSGDVLVSLSPQVREDLNKTVRSECGEQPIARCEQAIQTTLEQNSVNVQKRFVCGGVCTAGVVALVGIVLRKVLDRSHEVPTAVRLASSDIAQVTSYETATSTPTAVIVEDVSTTYTVNMPSPLATSAM